MRAGRFLPWWIAGSALATFVGLGFGGFIALMGLHEGSLFTAVPAAMMLGVAIALSVGLVQGLVLAARVDGLSAARWALDTGLGSVAAWALIGYPVRLLTAVDADARAWATVLPAAAGIGLVVGIVVAAAQWFELRRHAAHAGWSIPLLAVAWIVGAVVFFTANGLLAQVDAEAVAVSGAAAALLLTGAIVAAVQGSGLARLLAD